MKKTIIISICIIFLLSLVVYQVPLTQNIDVTHRGVQCRIGQSECQEDIIVKIEGKYKNYLIKADEFKGMITVSGYHFSDQANSVEFIVNDGIGSITYFGINDDYPDLETLGGISFSSRFKEVLIHIMEPVNSDAKGWNGEDGLYIVVPADSHEAALEMARELSKKSSWLSRVDWK